MTDKREISQDKPVRKALTAEVKVASESDRTIDFVISTDTVDLAGDTIAVAGWKLDNYKKNPVVLFAHDASSMPVGKATNVRVEDGKLKATVEFMTREISGFADAVFRALKAGFLSAVSVGFYPVKYAFVDDPERRFGVDFLEQILLEFSVVPVPCNPEALIEGRSFDAEPEFLGWARELVERSGLAVVTQKQMDQIRALPKRLRKEADDFAVLAAKKRETRGNAGGVGGASSICRKHANMVDTILNIDVPAKADGEDWRCAAARDLSIGADEPWDGNAAGARILDAAGFDGDNSDSEQARRGFLAFDIGNPALRGSYKLPFADMVDGEMRAMPAGIRAAASRLPQTDVPQSCKDDARAVIDHYEMRIDDMGDGDAGKSVPTETPLLDMARRRLDVHRRKVA